MLFYRGTHQVKLQRVDDMLLSKRAADLTGKTYGALLAIRPHHIDTNGSLYWLFKCTCGKEHIARGNVVKYQAKKYSNTTCPSCGCGNIAAVTKHGYRSAKNTHPAYAAYRSILDRCYNKNTPGYKNYGAKGITICAEWLNNPVKFIEWSLKNGWKNGLQIDKDILCNKLNIHPKIYSPETCQWVTPRANISYSSSRRMFGTHPNIKLSQEAADEICRLYFSGTITNKSQLARDFGLFSPSSIGKILNKYKDQK